MVRTRLGKTSPSALHKKGTALSQYGALAFNDINYKPIFLPCQYLCYHFLLSDHFMTAELISDHLQGIALCCRSSLLQFHCHFFPDAVKLIEVCKHSDQHTEHNRNPDKAHFNMNQSLFALHCIRYITSAF